MQYGLIGEHLGHSYSREIHARIADYPYELQEIPPEALQNFLERREFRAINVTIPYKRQVIPYLDWVSEEALRIGAVNTIVNKDGKLHGYNTDFAGMEALIRHAGLNLRGKKVLILGTGGTSKTAMAVADAGGACKILCVSRSGKDGAITYEEAIEKHRDAQIIINTTPVGMYPAQEGRPLDVSSCCFGQLEGILDAIYHPLRTNLVMDGMAHGIPSEGGLYMLVAQAVYASALFLGGEARPELIDRVYRSVLLEKQNIVLIGMPSAGKTAVGGCLARMTGKPFADTDTIILSRIGKPIASFMAEAGEAAFRSLESEIIRELSGNSGYILATGGGAVLNADNVYALRRNGLLVFLDRSLKNLTATSDRPLSSDRQALELLYQKRYPLYQKAADVHINADVPVCEVAESILKELQNI